jgi:hypothetical protein
VFEASALGDVSLIDGVPQMILRFHQRRPCDHDEARKVGRVESAETFGDMSGRPKNRFFELPAPLPVDR